MLCGPVFLSSLCATDDINLNEFTRGVRERGGRDEDPEEVEVKKGIKELGSARMNINSAHPSPVGSYSGAAFIPLLP